MNEFCMISIKLNNEMLSLWCMDDGISYMERQHPNKWIVINVQSEMSSQPCMEETSSQTY